MAHEELVADARKEIKFPDDWSDARLIRFALRFLVSNSDAVKDVFNEAHIRKVNEAHIRKVK